jgi:hypothetical protein
MAQLTRNAAPRPTMARPAVTARQVEALVQPEVWTMYDTLLFGASGSAQVDYVLGSSGTVPTNGQMQMFNSHTVGARGPSITSMTTSSGYVDYPFKAYGMGIEVFAPQELATAAGVPSAARFVEAIVNWGSITLQFATDYKLIIPVSDLPGGGGVNYGPQVGMNDTAAPTINLWGSACNGIQSVQARVMWKDYILFRGKDQPFTLNLNLQSQAVSLLNSSAVSTLGTNLAAGIRVKFWGYRGKSLISGAPFRG